MESYVRHPIDASPIACIFSVLNLCGLNGKHKTKYCRKNYIYMQSYLIELNREAKEELSK